MIATTSTRRNNTVERSKVLRSEQIMLASLNGLDENSREVTMIDHASGQSKARRRASAPAPTSKRVTASENKIKRKRRPPKVPWKKPKGMPKRPLSAYNLFFAFERDRLLKLQKEGLSEVANMPLVPANVSLPVSLSPTVFEDKREKKPRPHLKSSGIGFANLAKQIAARWKELELEQRQVFEAQAAIEKDRYMKEMTVWRKKQAEEKASSSSSPPSSNKPVKKSGGASKKEQTGPQKGGRAGSRRRSSEPTTQSERTSKRRTAGLSSAQRRMSEPVPETIDSNSTILVDEVSPSGSTTSYENDSPFDEDDILAENDAFETEATLEIDSFDLPLRSFSEPTFRGYGVALRSCEELAAELKQTPVHEKNISPASMSLVALQSNLDDETFKFLTNLRYD